jgi:puromycin-sensitive aminopeptidase
MMNSWIFQGGFPEVEIAQSPEGDGLLIEQQRFTYLPGPPPGEWHIPLVVRYEDGDRQQTATTIVGGSPEEIRSEGRIEWAIGNAGGNGFYRVRYTPELMDGLMSRLDRLQPLERHAVLDDAWAYLKAGRIDSSTYLDLASHYQDEAEAAVWDLLTGTLGRLHRIVPPESIAAYEGWVRNLIEPAADRLGWEAGRDEDDLTRKLRGILLRSLGTTGKQGQTRERARRIVDRLIEAPESVDPEIAVAAVYVTADAGAEADYRLFCDRYQNAADPQEEGRFLYALPEFRQPELAAETFEMVLDERIRTANGPMVVGRLLAHETNGDAVWDLITANWDRLMEMFPPMIAKRAVETIWTRHDRGDEIRAFLATHEVPLGGKAMAQALERLEIAEGLARRESNRLSRYVAG